MDGLRRIPLPRRTPVRGGRSRVGLLVRERLTSLRGPNRRMADALDQLRAGVPLNWTQVEDDPELATLAYLEDVAAEARSLAPADPPTSLRSEIIGSLGRHLPPPRPVKIKEAPKSLAGFSETVPVMTQVEEKVPALISRAPQIAGIVAATLGLVALIWWGVNAIASRPPEGLPTYRWIEVKQGPKPLSNVERPDEWRAPLCPDYKLSDPAAKRKYVSIPDTQQIQANVGFAIVFLPKLIAMPDPPTSTANFVMGLSGMAVSSCEEAFSTGDRGASVKIDYLANRSSAEGATRTAALSIFQGRQVPALLDAASGEWREVTVGKAHGVYWRGGPYNDPSGSTWIGDVSVMAIERGDLVMTLVGENSSGITEGFLTEVVRGIDRERTAEESTTTAPFTWIEMWRGSQMLRSKQLPADYEQPPCAASNEPTLFTRLLNRDIAQSRVGYAILSLPESIKGPDVSAERQPDEAFPRTGPAATPETLTLTTTYNLRLGDIALLPCEGETPDTHAKVKQRYTVRFALGERGQGALPPDYPTLQQPNVPQLSDIVAFETRRTPVMLHVEGGQWKEISVGDSRGIYWSGGQYHDIEGLLWQDGANVLTLERGDNTVTLISTVTPESLLIEVAKGIDWQGR